MNRLLLALLGLAVAALVVVTCKALEKAPLPAGDGRLAAPTSDAAPIAGSPAALAADELPPEVAKKYPPRTFTPLRLPRLKAGIRCPDGNFLPLLNGVTEPCYVKRIEWTGPMTPVIGKWTDDEGIEWWFHADGSVTTTRYLDVTHPDGRKVKTATTTHGAPRPDSAGLPGGDEKSAPKGAGGNSGVTGPQK